MGEANPATIVAMIKLCYSPLLHDVQTAWDSCNTHEDDEIEAVVHGIEATLDFFKRYNETLDGVLSVIGAIP